MTQDTKRVFLAITIPTHLKTKLARYLKSLNKYNLRITRPENLHITAHFLGDVRVEHLVNIATIIKFLCTEITPFTLNPKGVEQIENRIKTIWVTFKKSTPYKNLVISLETEFPSNKQKNRDYIAHIMLARFKKSTSLKNVELPNFQLADNVVHVHEIKLFESILGRDGPAYNLIETFKLKDKK
ncbi:MAG: RNA 2',3'-cyclic phosphodiesterase [Candidatus Curtissbacteria bacterium]|nr:RNA 2',3'-cyclic phosphodiesterase [Candidatus Curtissbacteria bacterium]